PGLQYSFFFQAEGGIRYGHVTGVQTCALPIFSSMSDAWMPFQPAIDEPSNACPASNLSLPKYFTGTVTCCSLPRVSVNRRSTNLDRKSVVYGKSEDLRWRLSRL